MYPLPQADLEYLATSSWKTSLNTKFKITLSPPPPTSIITPIPAHYFLFCAVIYWLTDHSLMCTEFAPICPQSTSCLLFLSLISSLNGALWACWGLQSLELSFWFLPSCCLLSVLYSVVLICSLLSIPWGNYSWLNLSLLIGWHWHHPLDPRVGVWPRFGQL